jgi:hypothetical protein
LRLRRLSDRGDGTHSGSAGDAIGSVDQIVGMVEAPLSPQARR